MLLVPIAAQDRQATSEPGYLLIDATQARSRLLRTTNFSKIRDRLAEAVGALELELSEEDLAAIERAVPAGAAAGGRYDERQMAMLDSERSRAT